MLQRVDYLLRVQTLHKIQIIIININWGSCIVLLLWLLIAAVTHYWRSGYNIAQLSLLLQLLVMFSAGVIMLTVAVGTGSYWGSLDYLAVSNIAIVVVNIIFIWYGLLRFMRLNGQTRFKSIVVNLGDTTTNAWRGIAIERKRLYGIFHA